MTPLDWNGLRLDDALFVHDPSVAAAAAEAGVVELVTVRSRRSNDVGIRLSDGDHLLVWPSWMAVHRGAVGAAGTCWRCDVVAAAAG